MANGGACLSRFWSPGMRVNTAYRSTSRQVAEDKGGKSSRMDQDDRFPVWVVLLGVAAGGGIAYLLANPRGKTLLRNLPRMLADLTQQSERVLGMISEVT